MYEFFKHNLQLEIYSFMHTYIFILLCIPLQNLEPLMQYLSSPDLQSQDYSNYDLPNSDSVYTDSDGDWYDNPSAPQALIGGPSYASQSSGDFLDNEPTEQDLALFQLMLDHIAGKYSLEDLETLEREARIEENTENQLRALTKKVILRR